MQKFKIVDLFAGAGGWSLASRHLGLPVVGVELPSGACEIRRAAGLATVEEDVRKLGPGDFPGGNVLVGRPLRRPLPLPARGVAAPLWSKWPIL